MVSTYKSSIFIIWISSLDRGSSLIVRAVLGILLIDLGLDCTFLIRGLCLKGSKLDLTFYAGINIPIYLPPLSRFYFLGERLFEARTNLFLIAILPSSNFILLDVI